MNQWRLQFGAKPKEHEVNTYSESNHWQDGKFQNLEETDMSLKFWEIPVLLYKQMTDKKKREPQQSLPIIPFDPGLFLDENRKPQFLWYGHSALLMRLDSKTILIDPMLGPDAAPIAPTQTKRFSDNTLDLIDHLPEIDLILLSHDHYDHLDYDSIQKLKGKTKEYFVALGVKRHLVKWGIEADKIKEFDWWDYQYLDSLEIHFTPTRHFSGRGLTDRAKSLWGGWVFKSDSNKIWFSGDGGYGDHFKEIGSRLGPFDFGFMECGQYNEKWRLIHLFPDESVQAALDAKVNKVMPVHWCGFSLSHHSWQEPAIEFVENCQKKELEYMVPRLGEINEFNSHYNQEKWWLTY
ncbi:MBL fold metallo-hydrolase [Membranihabitans marinus]|uniref:MBL fold metallo-hydrolase n=1 Tax=Membranihabitans marinus TaxID=1227546 RepID=UPI001F204B38|nr:MBL fold metallo-hydrolase [Membranihabitans marinus]